jgi:hypothetical protein
MNIQHYSGFKKGVAALNWIFFRADNLADINVHHQQLQKEG